MVPPKKQFKWRRGCGKEEQRKKKKRRKEEKRNEKRKEYKLTVYHLAISISRSLRSLANVFIFFEYILLCQKKKGATEREISRGEAKREGKGEKR